MEKDRNIKERLFYNREYLETYQKYEKYTKLLEEFNRSNLRGISYVQNLLNPAKHAKKIAEKYNISLEEFEKFDNKVDNLTEKNPELELNDLLTQEGRNTISDIIGESIDPDFIPTNLNIVAITENYNLCKKVDEIKDKTTSETIHILLSQKTDITPYTFLDNKKKYLDYKESKQELYDIAYGKKFPDIVHVISGVLELRPNNVESILISLGKINGHNLSDFEKSLKIQEEEVVSQLTIDLIMNNPNLSQEEKKQRLQEEHNKIAEINKFRRSTATQYHKNGHNPLNTSFANRHKLSYDISGDDRAG